MSHTTYTIVATLAFVVPMAVFFWWARRNCIEYEASHK